MFAIYSISCLLLTQLIEFGVMRGAVSYFRSYGKKITSILETASVNKDTVLNKNVTKQFGDHGSIRIRIERRF